MGLTGFSGFPLPQTFYWKNSFNTLATLCQHLCSTNLWFMDTEVAGCYADMSN